MDIVITALIAAVAAVAGYFGGRAAENSRLRRAKATAEEEAGRIVSGAEQEAENLRKAQILAGKEEAFRSKEEWEREENRRREDIDRAERRVQEREETLDRKFLLLDEKHHAQDQRAETL